jgi:hypothetical protein
VGALLLWSCLAWILYQRKIARPKEEESNAASWP